MRRLGALIGVVILVALAVASVDAQPVSLIPYRWPHMTGRFWYQIGYPAGWSVQSFGEGGVVFLSPDRVSSLAFLAGTFPGAMTPQQWLERIFFPYVRQTVPDAKIVALQDVSSRVAAFGARAIEAYAVGTERGIRILSAWQIMAQVISDPATRYTFTVVERYQLNGIPLRGGEARLRTTLASFSTLRLVGSGQSKSPELADVERFGLRVAQVLGGNY